MHDLRIAFAPFLDEPGHPAERPITIHNSLPVCDASYRGATLSVKQCSDGTTWITALHVDGSFIFDLPLRNLLLAALRASLVHYGRYVRLRL